MMKIPALLSLVILLHCQDMLSQQLPEGYILQYQQRFSGSKPLSDFTVNDSSSSGIYNQGGNYYLQCLGKVSQPSLPSDIAILSNRIFGDFILEVDVMPLADSNGFGEVCICLGMKDQSKYYYLRLANQQDSSHNEAYMVKKEVATRLIPISENPTTLTANKWHKIRIERDIVKRTIILYVDTMKSPVMRIKDYELIMGMLGFGSCSKPVRFDNISIWAPTMISE